MSRSLLRLTLSMVAALALTACQRESATEMVQDEAPAAPSAAAPPPAPAKPSAASFAGMDADGDGSLSAAEHQASSAAMFAAMDSDGDAMVSAGEMDAAQGRLGGSTAMS